MDINLREIHDQARENHVPVIKDGGLKFLLALLEEHTEVRDILEIGTAVGYSAIHMANVRWDMTVETLEVNPDMYKQALANVKAAGLVDRIQCHLCDGAGFYTKKMYDFVFVDAAKSQYRRYLEHFYNNTHVGSIFVFDNLSFHGIVDDETQSHNRSTIQMVHKIKKFREWILKDDRFESQYYPDTGDGIVVAIRVK